MIRPLLAAALLTAVVAAPLAGCSRVQAVKTTTNNYPATSPATVRILMTEPAERFEEVGTLNTSGWKQNETAAMHADLKSRAAGWGADAVYLKDTGVEGGRQWANAVAVKFTAEDPSVGDPDG